MRLVQLPSLSRRLGRNAVALVRSYPPELIGPAVDKNTLVLETRWPAAWIAMSAPEAVDSDLPDVAERRAKWDQWYDSFLGQCLGCTGDQVRKRFDPVERHRLLDAILETWKWQAMPADEFVTAVALLAKMTHRSPAQIIEQPLPVVAFDILTLARAQEQEKKNG